VGAEGDVEVVEVVADPDLGPHRRRAVLRRPGLDVELEGRRQLPRRLVQPRVDLDLGVDGPGGMDCRLAAAGRGIAGGLPGVRRPRRGEIQSQRRKDGGEQRIPKR